MPPKKKRPKTERAAAASSGASAAGAVNKDQRLRLIAGAYQLFLNEKINSTNAHDDGSTSARCLLPPPLLECICALSSITLLVTLRRSGKKNQAFFYEVGGDQQGGGLAIISSEPRRIWDTDAPPSTNRFLGSNHKHSEVQKALRVSQSRSGSLLIGKHLDIHLMLDRAAQVDALTTQMTNTKKAQRSPVPVPLSSDSGCCEKLFSIESSAMMRFGRLSYQSVAHCRLGPQSQQPGILFLSGDGGKVMLLHNLDGIEQAWKEEASSSTGAGDTKTLAEIAKEYTSPLPLDSSCTERNMIAFHDETQSLLVAETSGPGYSSLRFIHRYSLRGFRACGSADAAATIAFTAEYPASGAPPATSYGRSDFQSMAIAPPSSSASEAVLVVLNLVDVTFADVVTLIPHRVIKLPFFNSGYGIGMTLVPISCARHVFRDHLRPNLDDAVKGDQYAIALFSNGSSTSMWDEKGLFCSNIHLLETGLVTGTERSNTPDDGCSRVQSDVACIPIVENDSSGEIYGITTVHSP